MNKDIEEVLFSQEEIAKRCEEMAKEIEKDLEEGQEPILVGLLKGSVPFLAELMKHFSIPCETDYMQVSSYEGVQSMGRVRIVKDMDSNCKDRTVLIVEDIVDTGRTLTYVKDLIKNKGAKDVKIVSLLDKPEGRVVEIEADYAGFVVPNKFVVGFGLDYNQKYRNLPYIGVLKPEVYE